MSAKIVCMAIGAIVAIALIATTAEANKNPCIRSWTGPDKDNSLVCPSSGSEVQEYANESGLFFNLIPLVLGIVTLFPCCCVFICGRYCCQCLGGSTMRPATTCCECCCGNSAYDAMPEEEKVNLYPMYSTIIVKVLTGSCFVVCAVALILGILGGLDTKNNSQTMVTAFGDGFQVFIDMATDLNASIRDPNNASKVPSGFDASQFDTFKADMLKQKQDLTDQMQPVADGLETYSLIPAFIIIVPTLCLLAALVSAVCNIRSVLPLIVILSNFLLQFLFFFVATLILFALFPINILCDEVNSSPGEKGVLNWMMLPQCDDSNPLKDLDDQVREMEKDGSVEACTGLLEICDTNTIWNIADQEKIFVCNITNATNCDNFDTVSGTINAMYFKSGAEVYDNCSGISPCTVRNCSTSCTQDETKNFAVSALDSVDTVTRVLKAYNEIISPFLSCRKLFDLVLNSGPKQGCDLILKGLNTFKNGLLMCGSACWISIFVLFLGQKRFSCPDAGKAPDALGPNESYNEADGDNHIYGNPNKSKNNSMIVVVNQSAPPPPPPPPQNMDPYANPAYSQNAANVYGQQAGYGGNDTSAPPPNSATPDKMTHSPSLGVEMKDMDQ